MKKQNLRNNQILTNKLNQRNYLYKDGVAEEILTEEQIALGIESEKIPVNESNVVCFVVAEDPNYDQYDVVNGVFLANGRPVSTGNIKVLKVLVSGKRKGLLAVALRDGEEGNGVDIFTYNASIDKFAKLASNVVLTNEDPIMVNNTAIFKYENRRTETNVTYLDDGSQTKEEYEVLEKSGLIEFNKETCYGGAYELGIILGDCKTIADGYEPANIDKSLVFVANEVVDADPFYPEDNDELPDIVKLDDGKISVVVINVSPDGRLCCTSYDVYNGEFESAVRSGRYLIVKTDKLANLGNFMLTNAEALLALKGYPYLVKNVENEKTGVRTIAMATSDLRVATVTITKTDDRGEIVEIV